MVQLGFSVLWNCQRSSPSTINKGEAALPACAPVAPAGGPLTHSETSGPNAAENQCERCAADPVNTASGDYFERSTDLSIPGRGPALAWTRAYNSASAASASSPGPLGYGWTDNYNMSLAIDTGTGAATVTEESGSQVMFVAASDGTFTTAAPRELATLVHNCDGSYTFTRRKRDRFIF